MESILSVSPESLLQPVDLVYVYKDATSGVKMVELHVDLLDIERCQYPLGGSFSVRFTAWKNAQPYDQCPYGKHSPGCCKCHLPLIFIGQDESIFMSYSESANIWILGVE